MNERHRAGPMAPEERRRAIVEAIIPLLVERGHTVTTKEMAEAAGIAEGTIFNVFADKAAVIEEAVRACIDPAPVVKQLAMIFPEAPLEVQLAEAARIMFEQMDAVLGLLSIVRTLYETGEPRPPGPPAFVAAANATINEALANVLERHRDRLRLEPARAASALRGLIVATGHPAMGFSERLSIHEVVEILLTGITIPETTRVS